MPDIKRIAKQGSKDISSFSDDIVDPEFEMFFLELESLVITIIQPPPSFIKWAIECSIRTVILSLRAIVVAIAMAFLTVFAIYQLAFFALISAKYIVDLLIIFLYESID